MSEANVGVSQKPERWRLLVIGQPSTPLVIGQTAPLPPYTFFCACKHAQGAKAGAVEATILGKMQTSNASVSHFLGKKMLNHDNRTKRYLHKVFCLMRCVIGDYICIFTKNRKFRNISRNLDVNVAVSLLRN